MVILDSSFGSYICIDEDYHAREYNLSEVTLCVDCGVTINERIIQYDVGEKEAHDFYILHSSKCRCISCDYEYNCEHENTEIITVSEGNFAIPIDENVHGWNCVNYQYLHCKDCGASFENSSGLWEKTEYTAPHTFVDGVCTECGFEFECAHKSTYRGLLTQINASYEQKDATTHTYTYDSAWEIICADCGERVAEEIVQTGLHGTEEHQLERWGSRNNVEKCKHCGYLAIDFFTCAHERTEKLDPVQTAYDKEILAVTETEHTVSYHVMGSATKCLDCGMILDYDRGAVNVNRTSNVTSPHTFNENGVCTVCRYRKTEVESTASPAPSAMPTTSPTQKPTVRPVYWPTAVPTYVTGGGSAASSSGTAGSQSTQRATTAPSQRTALVKSSAAPSSGSASAANETLNAVSLLQSGGSVEVVGAKAVFTAEEHAALCALPATEQVLVTLIAAGYSDVAQEMMRSAGITLSDDAFSLMQQILQRFAAMPADERAALQEIMDDLFLAEERTVNGAVCVSLTLTLRIQMGGVTATVSIDLEAVREGDAL